MVTRRGKSALAVAALVALWGGTTEGQWKVQTYRDPEVGRITNYASSDALIGGFNLAAGFPVTSTYTSSNTQDNNDGGGNFGLGVQVVGLPAGDNDDFVFVGTGNGFVDLDGTYTFYTNTDDGSRLRASLNGGPLTQIISDDVLSGPHEVASPAIPLATGNTFSFEWMWFERGGGAEGELYYSPNGGANKYLITDDTGGLVLNGGNYEGKVYKSTITGGVTLGTDGLTKSQTMHADPTKKIGETLSNVLNVTGNGGTGFYGGDTRPPGLPDGDINDYTVKGTGFLKVVTEGDYKFGMLGDDGGLFQLKSQDGTTTIAEINDPTYHGAGFPGDVKLSATVHLTPGFYPISAFFFEAGGGDTYEVFLVNPAYAGAQNAITAGDMIALLGDTANGGLEIVQEVPEPSALALMGLGAAAMLRRRRK